MLRIVSVVLVSILFPTFAFAQPRAYFRSNGQFLADGNEYARGFWVPTVNGAEEVFKSNPVALEEYNQHLELGKWFGILNWGALGLFVTYTVIASASNNFNGTAGLLIFGVPWISGLYVGAKSNQHLLRAVNIINGVPVPEARHQPSLQVPLIAWSF